MSTYSFLTNRRDLKTDAGLDTFFANSGRTGRFGRKGVAIAFVHDKRSWEEMNAIQVALGREIVRVETGDFDEMEKVSEKELATRHLQVRRVGKPSLKLTRPRPFLSFFPRRLSKLLSKPKELSLYRNDPNARPSFAR